MHILDRFKVISSNTCYGLGMAPGVLLAACYGFESQCNPPNDNSST
jgi:hypothetical protein